VGVRVLKMILGLPIIRAGEKYNLSPHFGRAPYFALVEVDGNEYRVLEVIENPHVKHEHGRGAGVIDLVTSRGVNALIVQGIGYSAFNLLRERGVRVYSAPETLEGLITLEEAVKMFVEGKLEEAEGPRESHGRHGGW
jgi:predicted Fe-Mo cluster-binding NifX family protein